MLLEIFQSVNYVSPFIVIVIAIVLIGIPIWAIVDAASKPGSAFVSAGSSKSMWIVLIAVFTVLFWVIGFGLGLYYLTVVRSKVNASVSSSGET